MPVSDPIRLSELTEAIFQTLNQGFAGRTFWVIAEVTSHTFKAERNHHFFDLVEKGGGDGALLARVQGRAWGKGALSIAHFERTTGQRFTNNIRVLVNVSVAYNPVYGLSLQLNEIDVSYTLGALEQQRQATLERLVAENPDFIRRVGDRFWTRNQDVVLARVIQRIAVVSSQTSAGREDFHHTLETNPFGYRFAVDDYFAVVQGENNAEQLVARLVDVFNSGKAYDAVVIIRGGGAQTDFLIFDQYRVGLAVAKFPIPVITGIGHQKNETIADLMAHTQTKTPTKAAEFVIERNRAFEEAMAGLRQAIIIRAQQHFSAHSEALARLERDVHGRARATLYNLRKDLGLLAAAIPSSGARYLKQQSALLGHFVSMVRIASPAGTLRRGFAIVKANGKVIADAGGLAEGGEMSILFARQEIQSTITSKKDYHGSEFDI